MGFLTVIIAIFIGLLAFAIISYLAYLFYLSTFGNSRSFFEKRKVKRLTSSLDSIDQQILLGVTPSLIENLEKAFFLDLIKSDRQQLEAVHTHNLEVLARILKLSEKNQGHLKNIGVVEDLFDSRFELLDLYIKTHSLKDKIKTKLKQKDRDIPQWSQSEFDRKIVSIEEELKTNTKTLEQQIKLLLESLKDMSSVQGMVYH